MKKFMDTISNSYNAAVGTAIAILTMILGDFWFLFVAFMILNIMDWYTGRMKAKSKNAESSEEGLKGIKKKLGYWIMIGLAFLTATVLIEIGAVLNVDLGVTTLLGFMVLASLIVNEIRSIVENLIELGYKVPAVLTKGLAVADKIINKEDYESE